MNSSQIRTALFLLLVLLTSKQLEVSAQTGGGCSLPVQIRSITDVEADFKKTISSYEKSRAEIMPGDNFPRLLRLAHFLTSFGEFYLQQKRMKEANDCFQRALTLTRNHKGANYIDYHRYLAHQIASAYLRAKDYANCQTYLDESIKVAEENVKERETLPGLYRTQADLYIAQKKFENAAKTLELTIKLHEKYAYADQIALVGVYVELKQFDKAREVLEQAKNSPFKKSKSFLSANAKILRATGNAAAADALEEQVSQLESRGD